MQRLELVGWVEQRATHHSATGEVFPGVSVGWRERSVFMQPVMVLADITMGCAALHPSYPALV
jgi:hypothetical protein